MSTSGKAVRLHLKFGDVSWTSPEFELSDHAVSPAKGVDQKKIYEVDKPIDSETPVSAELEGLKDGEVGKFVLQPLRADSGKMFTGIDGGRLYAEFEGKKTYEIPMLKDGDGCAVQVVLKWSQDASRDPKEMVRQACILVWIKPTESTRVAFKMMNEILEASGIVSHLAQREAHFSFGKFDFDSDDSFDPRGMLASWSRLGAIERFLNTVERPLDKIARSSKLGLASVACNLPLREVIQLDPVKLPSQLPRDVNPCQLPNLTIKAQKTQGTRNTCLNQAIAKSLELVSGDIQKELDQLTVEVKNGTSETDLVLQIFLKRFEDLKRRCEALRSASEPWIAMRNAKDPPADRNYDVKPREGPGADVMDAIEQYWRDARSIEPGREKGLFARVVEGLSAAFKYPPRIYEEWLFLRMMRALEALKFRETGGERSPFELWRDRIRANENATRMFFKDEENLTFDLTSDPPLKLRCRICFHVKADIENPDGTVKPGGINGLNHRVVAKSYSDEKKAHNSPECLMIFERSEAASGAFYSVVWDAKYGKEKKDLKKKCRTTIDKYKNNFEIDGKPLARVFTLCWLGNSSKAKADDADVADDAGVVRYDKVIFPTFDSDADRLKTLFGDIAYNALCTVYK